MCSLQDILFLCLLMGNFQGWLSGQGSREVAHKMDPLTYALELTKLLL
ncbi:hypothetical protein AAZX31_10G110500 [Glycine max]